MRTAPGDVTDRAVADGLRAFGIDPVSVRYLPVGFGDHHWSVHEPDGRGWFASVADLWHKPHCGADPVSTLAGLRAAMSTARELRTAGLEFVCAPQPAPQGTAVLPLGERYALSVFPETRGETGDFDTPLTGSDLDRVLDLLARLHAMPAPDSTPRSALEPDGLDRLESAELAEPWRAGPLSDDAQQLLGQHADALASAVRELRERARRLRSRRSPLVVTHGEPHRGNLIRAATGFVLVDWDTTAVAAPERDLAVLGADPDRFDAYTAVTGHTPDRDAIALHRLRWSLVDVLEFADLFRVGHEDTEDTRSALDGLRSTLRDLS